MADVPDSLDQADPVPELGGAIGRRASVACEQGQHDLCSDSTCMCRHHTRHFADIPRCSLDRPCAVRNPLHLALWGECFTLEQL